jgi:hypothetical protein
MTTPTQGEHAQPEALRGAPPSAYSQEDHAFYTFWYGHMLNELMQPPLAGVSHSTARYIWDAAIAHVAAQPAAPQGGAYAELPEPDVRRLAIESGLIRKADSLRPTTWGRILRFARAVQALRASHGQAPAAAYSPLTLTEARDLTCMLAGAPWPDEMLPELQRLLTIYDGPRANNQRPVDPATLPRKVGKEVMRTGRLPTTAQQAPAGDAVADSATLHRLLRDMRDWYRDHPPAIHYQPLLDQVEAALAAAPTPAAQAADSVTRERLKEVLGDPAAVHLNMLHGHIATITMEQCAHLHGPEAQRKWAAADSVLEDAARWFAERDNVLQSFWVLLGEAEVQADNDNNPLLKHQVEGFYRQWNALNGSALEPRWVTRAARKQGANHD